VSELDDKLKQTAGLMPDKQLEDQAIAENPLTGELERLLEIKRRLEDQKR
jgi:hypothetical protein